MSAADSLVETLITSETRYNHFLNSFSDFISSDTLSVSSNVRSFLFALVSSLCRSSRAFLNALSEKSESPARIFLLQKEILHQHLDYVTIAFRFLQNVILHGSQGTVFTNETSINANSTYPQSSDSSAYFEKLNGFSLLQVLLVPVARVFEYQRWIMSLSTVTVPTTEDIHRTLNGFQAALTFIVDTYNSSSMDMVSSIAGVNLNHAPESIFLDVVTNCASLELASEYCNHSLKNATVFFFSSFIIICCVNEYGIQSLCAIVPLTKLSLSTWNSGSNTLFITSEALLTPEIDRLLTRVAPDLSHLCVPAEFAYSLTISLPPSLGSYVSKLLSFSSAEKSVTLADVLRRTDYLTRYTRLTNDISVFEDAVSTLYPTSSATVDLILKNESGIEETKQLKSKEITDTAVIKSVESVDSAIGNSLNLISDVAEVTSSVKKDNVVEAAFTSIVATENLVLTAGSLIHIIDQSLIADKEDVKISSVPSSSVIYDDFDSPKPRFRSLVDLVSSELSNLSSSSQDVNNSSMTLEFEAIGPRSTSADVEFSIDSAPRNSWRDLPLEMLIKRLLSPIESPLETAIARPSDVRLISGVSNSTLSLRSVAPAELARALAASVAGSFLIASVGELAITQGQPFHFAAFLYHSRHFSNGVSDVSGAQLAQLGRALAAAGLYETMEGLQAMMPAEIRTSHYNDVVLEHMSSNGQADRYINFLLRLQGVISDTAVVSGSTDGNVPSVSVVNDSSLESENIQPIHWTCSQLDASLFARLPPTRQYQLLEALGRAGDLSTATRFVVHIAKTSRFLMEAPQPPATADVPLTTALLAAYIRCCGYAAQPHLARAVFEAVVTADTLHVEAMGSTPTGLTRVAPGNAANISLSFKEASKRFQLHLQRSGDEPHLLELIVGILESPHAAFAFGQRYIAPSAELYCAMIDAYAFNKLSELAVSIFEILLVRAILEENICTSRLVVFRASDWLVPASTYLHLARVAAENGDLELFKKIVKNVESSESGLPVEFAAFAILLVRRITEAASSQNPLSTIRLFVRLSEISNVTDSVSVLTQLAAATAVDLERSSPASQLNATSAVAASSLLEELKLMNPHGTPSSLLKFTLNIRDDIDASAQHTHAILPHLFISSVAAALPPVCVKRSVQRLVQQQVHVPTKALLLLLIRARAFAASSDSSNSAESRNNALGATISSSNNNWIQIPHLIEQILRMDTSNSLRKPPCSCVLASVLLSLNDLTNARTALTDASQSDRSPPDMLAASYSLYLERCMVTGVSLGYVDALAHLVHLSSVQAVLKMDSHVSELLPRPSDVLAPVRLVETNESLIRITEKIQALSSEFLKNSAGISVDASEELRAAHRHATLTLSARTLGSINRAIVTVISVLTQELTTFDYSVSGISAGPKNILSDVFWKIASLFKLSEHLCVLNPEAAALLSNMIHSDADNTLKLTDLGKIGNDRSTHINEGSFYGITPDQAALVLSEAAEAQSGVLNAFVRAVLATANVLKKYVNFVNFDSFSKDFRRSEYLDSLPHLDIGHGLPIPIDMSNLLSVLLKLFTVTTNISVNSKQKQIGSEITGKLINTPVHTLVIMKNRYLFPSTATISLCMKTLSTSREAGILFSHIQKLLMDSLAVFREHIEAYNEATSLRTLRFLRSTPPSLRSFDTMSVEIILHRMTIMRDTRDGSGLSALWDLYLSHCASLAESHKTATWLLNHSQDSVMETVSVNKYNFVHPLVIDALFTALPQVTAGPEFDDRIVQEELVYKKQYLEQVDEEGKVPADSGLTDEEESLLLPPPMALSILSDLIKELYQHRQPITVKHLATTISLFARIGQVFEARLLLRMLVSPFLGEDYTQKSLERDVDDDCKQIVSVLKYVMSLVYHYNDVEVQQDSNDNVSRFIAGRPDEGTRLTDTHLLSEIAYPNSKHLEQATMEAAVYRASSRLKRLGVSSSGFAFGSRQLAGAPIDALRPPLHDILDMDGGGFCALVVAAAEAGVPSIVLQLIDIAFELDSKSSYSWSKPSSTDSAAPQQNEENENKILDSVSLLTCFSALAACGALNEAETLLSDTRFHPTIVSKCYLNTAFSSDSHSFDTIKHNSDLSLAAQWATRLPLLASNRSFSTKIAGIDVEASFINGKVEGTDDSIRQFLSHMPVLINTIRIASLAETGNVHLSLRLLEFLLSNHISYSVNDDLSHTFSANTVQMSSDKHHRKAGLLSSSSNSNGLEWNENLPFLPVAVSAVLEALTLLPPNSLSLSPAEDLPVSESLLPYIKAHTLLGNSVLTAVSKPNSSSDRAQKEYGFTRRAAKAFYESSNSRLSSESQVLDGSANMILSSNPIEVRLVALLKNLRKLGWIPAPSDSLRFIRILGMEGFTVTATLLGLLPFDAAVRSMLRSYSLSSVNNKLTASNTKKDLLTVTDYSNSFTADERKDDQRNLYVSTYASTDSRPPAALTETVSASENAVSSLLLSFSRNTDFKRVPPSSTANQSKGYLSVLLNGEKTDLEQDVNSEINAARVESIFHFRELALLLYGPAALTHTSISAVARKDPELHEILLNNASSLSSSSLMQTSFLLDNTVTGGIRDLLQTHQAGLNASNSLPLPNTHALLTTLSVLALHSHSIQRKTSLMAENFLALVRAYALVLRLRPGQTCEALVGFILAKSRGILVEKAAIIAAMDTLNSGITSYVSAQRILRHLLPVGCASSVSKSSSTMDDGIPSFTRNLNAEFSRFPLFNNAIIASTTSSKASDIQSLYINMNPVNYTFIGSTILSARIRTTLLASLGYNSAFPSVLSHLAGAFVPSSTSGTASTSSIAPSKSVDYNQSTKSIETIMYNNFEFDASDTGAGRPSSVLQYLWSTYRGAGRIPQIPSVVEVRNYLLYIRSSFSSSFASGGAFLGDPIQVSIDDNGAFVGSDGSTVSKEMFASKFYQTLTASLPGNPDSTVIAGGLGSASSRVPTLPLEDISGGVRSDLMSTALSAMNQRYSQHYNTVEAAHGGDEKKILDTGDSVVKNLTRTTTLPGEVPTNSSTAMVPLSTLVTQTHTGSFASSLYDSQLDVSDATRSLAASVETVENEILALNVELNQVTDETKSTITQLETKFGASVIIPSSGQLSGTLSDAPLSVILPPDFHESRKNESKRLKTRAKNLKNSLKFLESEELSLQASVALVTSARAAYATFSRSLKAQEEEEALVREAITRIRNSVNGLETELNLLIVSLENDAPTAPTDLSAPFTNLKFLDHLSSAMTELALFEAKQKILEKDDLLRNAQNSSLVRAICLSSEKHKENMRLKVLLSELELKLNDLSETFSKIVSAESPLHDHMIVLSERLEDVKQHVKKTYLGVSSIADPSDASKLLLTDEVVDIESVGEDIFGATMTRLQRARARLQAAETARAVDEAAQQRARIDAQVAAAAAEGAAAVEAAKASVEAEIATVSAEFERRAEAAEQRLKDALNEELRPLQQLSESESRALLESRMVLSKTLADEEEELVRLSRYNALLSHTLKLPFLAGFSVDSQLGSTHSMRHGAKDDMNASISSDVSEESVSETIRKELSVEVVDAPNYDTVTTVPADDVKYNLLSTVLELSQDDVLVLPRLLDEILSSFKYIPSLEDLLHSISEDEKYYVLSNDSSDPSVSSKELASDNASSLSHSVGRRKIPDPSALNSLLSLFEEESRRLDIGVPMKPSQMVLEMPLKDLDIPISPYLSANQKHDDVSRGLKSAKSFASFSSLHNLVNEDKRPTSPFMMPSFNSKTNTDSASILPDQIAANTISSYLRNEASSTNLQELSNLTVLNDDVIKSDADSSQDSKLRAKLFGKHTKNNSTVI